MFITSFPTVKVLCLCFTGKIRDCSKKMETWVLLKCYQRQDWHKNTLTIKTFFVLLSCHSMALLSQLILEHGCQAWQAPHNLCWKFSPALGGWRKTTSLIPFSSNRHSREEHKYDHSWQMFLQHLTHICMSPKLETETWPWGLSCKWTPGNVITSLTIVSWESNYRQSSNL